MREWHKNKLNLFSGLIEQNQKQFLDTVVDTGEKYLEQPISTKKREGKNQLLEEEIKGLPKQKKI